MSGLVSSMWWLSFLLVVRRCVGDAVWPGFAGGASAAVSGARSPPPRAPGASAAPGTRASPSSTARPPTERKPQSQRGAGSASLRVREQNQKTSPLPKSCTLSGQVKHSCTRQVVSYHQTNMYLCRERERDLLRLDLDLDLERECLRLLSFLPEKYINASSIFVSQTLGEKKRVFRDNLLTAGLNRSRDEGLRLSDSLHGFLDFLVGRVCLQPHARCHRVHPARGHIYLRSALK